MANTIDTSLYLSNHQKEQKKTGSNNLGKDDFLKILMVQLQNQDPSSPMEDKEFISQMATFSTLEQITNMNTNILRLVESQEQNQLISYSQFIGKEVSWHKIVETENDGEEPTIQEGSGKVVSVQFKNGTATFTLEDQTILEPENISELKESRK
ncbi:flagellar hook assembly protein FlgD [Bacillus dakarensis]|uniref:flagellar hook assembly protein FlgD n=1 Tax=Robertmurraya dakarensis TaxID=1926278 RepID=UPI000980D4A9|nr:flagellar hook assembly protein FlgD [Bacillus dakarensis]